MKKISQTFVALLLALVDLILGRTPKDTTSTDISDEPATEPAQAPRHGGQFDE